MSLSTSTIGYKGIQYRLGLSENYDIRSLVKSRAEMFRLGIPQRRLERWKQELLAGKHLPSWVREIENEVERRQIIERIETNDVFRNQFRAEADSPRTPIEIINWGLEHIDRLRKVNVESRAEKRKRFTEVVIPILSTIVALVALLSGYYLQRQALNTQESLQQASLTEQRRLKYYEVESKPRQEGYSSFMQSLIETYDSASKNDTSTLNASLGKMESIYYGIEPLLVGDTVDRRQPVWDKYQQLINILTQLKDQPAGTPERKTLDDAFRVQREAFRAELYEALINPK